jgi:putative transposase
MGKQYQTRDAEASTPELTIPAEVSVALAEIAHSASEGLLALSVGAGLQVMQTLMEESVTALAGPTGRHDPDRVAVRHGHEQGSVTWAAAASLSSGPGSGPPTAPVSFRWPPTSCSPRPKCWATGAGADASRAVCPPLPARAGAGRHPGRAGRHRHLEVGDLAPVCRHDPHRVGRAPGRRPVRAGLGVPDGRRRALRPAHLRGRPGDRHRRHQASLALVEGSTENATLARELLVDLRERGLDTTRPILCIIDGAKALRRAITDVFDHPVIARCQRHKIRNVRDRLPQRLGGPVERRMRAAYHAPSALDGQAQLEALACELDKTHPGAAASLREGMAETLTVLRLGVPPTLARTLHSTNPIESMIEICREHAGNVKRWQDGQMALRWCAAGMVEAGKQFRRVNGYLHLPALRAALQAEVTRTVTGPCEDHEEVEAA